MKVMVDLDGVCYDFGQALRQWLIEEEGRSEESLPMPPRSWHFYREQWGMTDQEFVAACGRGVDGGRIFFSGPVMPGAAEGLRALMIAGHTIHLVTDRGFGKRSVEGTEHWLRVNRIPYTTLSFSGDKTIVDADIYLDDRPKNIEAIRAAGKRAVTFDQLWNRDVPGERAYSWPNFVLMVEEATPTLIGISGYARSGKDTVAAALVANHGFTRIGFADSLKALAYGMNPLIATDNRYWRLADEVDLHGWEVAKGSSEVRQLLQRLGTEGGRKVMPGIWVEALFKRAAGIPKLVVPDVRFPDEADAIRARGGQVWRIHRPGVEATNGHISETALDGFDFDADIHNTGTIDTLDTAVSVLLGSVMA